MFWFEIFYGQHFKLVVRRWKSTQMVFMILLYILLVPLKSICLFLWLEWYLWLETCGIFSPCSGHFRIRIEKILNVAPEMKSNNITPGGSTLESWKMTSTNIHPFIKMSFMDFSTLYFIFGRQYTFVRMGVPKSNLEKIGQNTPNTHFEKWG